MEYSSGIMQDKDKGISNFLPKVNLNTQLSIGNRHGQDRCATYLLFSGQNTCPRKDNIHKEDPFWVYVSNHSLGQLF